MSRMSKIQQYQQYIDRIMQEEKLSLKTLEILCIGQVRAGKSYFLNKYSKDEAKQTLHGSYAIFAKKVNEKLIIFHQLSEEEEIYLEKKYDGIIFFVDLVGTWNVTENILKWMELQSRLTGVNIFKIPLRVIITQTKSHKHDFKWRTQLQNQLASLINSSQIIYFEDIQSIELPLETYFEEIATGNALGIKSTQQNNYRIYGITHFLKLFALSTKLTFFRSAEVVQKYVGKRTSFDLKTKSN